MKVKISRQFIDQILADVRGDLERERCGLLLGKGREIMAVRAAPNVHPQPEQFFELDPTVLIEETRRARSDDWAVLGHYHSHPYGMPEPSITDAAMAAEDGRYWLIIGRDGALGMWQSVASGAWHGRFNQLVLDIL